MVSTDFAALAQSVLTMPWLLTSISTIFALQIAVRSAASVIVKGADLSSWCQSRLVVCRYVFIDFPAHYCNWWNINKLALIVIAAEHLPDAKALLRLSAQSFQGRPNPSYNTGNRSQCKAEN